MIWRLKPIKVQCPQCKITDIFSPLSDLIWGFRSVTNGRLKWLLLEK